MLSGSQNYQQQLQQQQQVSSTIDMRTIDAAGNNGGLRSITAKKASSKSEPVSAELQSYRMQTKNAAVYFNDIKGCMEAKIFTNNAAYTSHCIIYRPYLDLRDYVKHEEAIQQVSISQQEQQFKDEHNVVPFFFTRTSHSR